MANTLFDEPYLSTDPKHQGLLLHSVYHRPNGWDYVAPGQKVPNGESSMWGDYHARELALLLLREARGENYLTFFDWQGRPRTPLRAAAPCPQDELGASFGSPWSLLCFSCSLRSLWSILRPSDFLMTFALCLSH